MKNTTLPALLVTLALVPGAALANGITAVTFEGTGCERSGVGKSIAGDGSSATLIFDDFIAVEHPSFPEGSDVRNCRVTVTLAAPEATGVQALVRGYVQLDGGVAARQQQHVISMKQGNTVARFSGPVSRDYLTQTQGVLRGGQGSSSTFTIQLQVEVDGAPGTQGMATIDSIDIVLGAP